jgi:hypothetical protein
LKANVGLLVMKFSGDMSENHHVDESITSLVVSTF